MSDGYGTTVGELHAAAGHVLAVNDAVQAELAALRARLAPLAGAWRGEAATAFAGLMGRWDADARLLGSALCGIGEAIRDSAADYRSQEDQTTATLSAIRAALG